MPKQIKEIEKFIKENSVRGWLSQREGILLYKLAKSCPKGSVIVEIGSWEGRSTIYLSNGSMIGNSAQIYAVDPHTGPGMGRKNISTYNKFINNISRGGIISLVTPLVKFSEEAAKDFNKPIGLIFIDGDHSYESVKLDFEKWYPKIIDGGVLAFHDSIKHDGPRKLLREIIPGSPYFKNAGIIDSTFFVTKTPQNNLWERMRNRYILLIRKSIEYGAHIDYKYKFPKELKVIHKKIISYVQGIKT